MTLQYLHVAAIVIVIHAKITLAGRFDAEVAAGHAEIVGVVWTNVKRGGTLPQDQACSKRAVFKGKVIKLDHSVFREESDIAAFKFHFGASSIGSQCISLMDRKIQRSDLPLVVR